MKLLFSVFDRKAKSYGPLMSYAHEAQATRDFSQAVLDPQSHLGKYAEDFVLRQVGKFENVSGVLLPPSGDGPSDICEAKAVLALSSTGPKAVAS